MRFYELNLLLSKFIISIMLMTNLLSRFQEISRTEEFDCYIFHDVDMLPENDLNLYFCDSNNPKHIGSYVDKYNYRLIE